MKSNLLVEKLMSLNKPFYTLGDIQTITGKSRAVTRVLVSRLAKNGLLIRLLKNIYIPKAGLINYEVIAQAIEPDSYLSFESALNRYDILDQIPYVITLATFKKSKTLSLGERDIVYRKIKKELFGNYSLKNNLKIAVPEKALLDSLYLISRGKMKLPLDELNFSVINRNKLKRLLTKYPTNVKEQCKKLFN